MVKVLPVPVAPSRVWKRSPLFQAVDKFGDGLGLVAHRLEVGLEFKFRHESPFT